MMEDTLWLIVKLSLTTVGIMAMSPIFWLTLWFTYRYYLKYEWDKASARQQALASSIEGIGAGFLVIWLISWLGLVVQPSMALICMGPVSMVLSLWKPRFLCMSYGAGLTAAIFWLLGKPVDGAGIASVVAILHLAEGLLVFIFGSQHTTKVYQQSRCQLQAASGIYRFWPVPVCLLIVIAPGKGGLRMPDWWPLLPLNDWSAENLCGLLPLVVTLGYSDRFARATEAQNRCLQNGLLIIGYALILLLLSLAAAHEPICQPLSLIFMIFGHEAIVKGRILRKHGKT